MPSTKWRRFIPRKPRFVGSKLDKLFGEANSNLSLYTAMSFDDLDHAIEQYKKRMNDANVVEWLTLVIMQSPRAAHAQAIMSEHPHGFHDSKKRLYELIDFNDAFVSTVLLLPDEALENFAVRLKQAMDQFCESVHSRTFDIEQFEAVVHGMSREIAVYKAAENAGLKVHMSSRAADAFGIDMQVADSVTGRYINIDCKTSSAFHFRLKDLIKRRRMQAEDMPDAETKGWWEVTNHGDQGRARIILLRVSQDELGEIQSFRFENEQAIVEKLRQIIDQRGLHDGRYGCIFQSVCEVQRDQNI